MNYWNNFSFQNSSSFMMEHIFFFYDHMMILLCFILFYILFLKMYSNNKFFFNFFLENENLELFWIIFPSIILFFIAIPSMKMLYISEEMYYSSILLKSVGHQWYWSYEFMLENMNNFEMNMYMKKSKIFKFTNTTNFLILPIEIPIQILTTSSDVIHSWTIPSLNIKSDSVPGRINQLNILINLSTILFGQCSEICGMNHSFMPINIRSIHL